MAMKTLRLFPLVGRVPRADRAQPEGMWRSDARVRPSAQGEQTREDVSGAQSCRARARARSTATTALTAVAGDHRMAGRDVTRSRRCCRRRRPARARVRAIALAIACDIHPLNNLRVLQLSDGHARRRRGAQGRLVHGTGSTPGLEALEAQLAARACDGHVLSRRCADARRHLPGAAARQRAARRHSTRQLSDAAAHRGSVAARCRAFARRRADRAAGRRIKRVRDQRSSEQVRR